MYREKYDLIVVGAGPGGFPAAIAAARNGLSVLLIERTAQLGGLLSTSLPPLAFLDRAGNKVIGGIAQEIVDRLKAVGASEEHMRVPIQNSMTIINGSWTRIVLFEMCDEAGVDVLLYAEPLDVRVDNGKVTGIMVQCRGQLLYFDAETVVDGTGDACVAAMAGARYEKSKELQPATITFTMGNIMFDKVFAYLRENPDEMRLPDGFEGIDQSLDHLLSLPNIPVMGFFELIKKAVSKGDFDVPRNMIDFVTMPAQGQAFFNVTRAVGCDTSDYLSVNNAEKECHRQAKETILFLKKYVPGFEDANLISMAPSLGSRESRRVVGKKTLTARALDNLDIPNDTVALAGYNVDVHSPSSGTMSILPIERAIGVPYGCLLPVSVEGLLLSGRTISVDPTIFGMTRVMSTCMAVGEACGMAAAIAHRKELLPSQVDVQELRAELEKAGVILNLD